MDQITGVRSGAAVRLDRIMPVVYSPVIVSVREDDERDLAERRCDRERRERVVGSAGPSSGEFTIARLISTIRRP